MSLWPRNQAILRPFWWLWLWCLWWRRRLRRLRGLGGLGGGLGGLGGLGGGLGGRIGVGVGTPVSAKRLDVKTRSHGFHESPPELKQNVHALHGSQRHDRNCLSGQHDQRLAEFSAIS